MSNKIMKTLTINGVTYQVQDPRVTDLTEAFDNAVNNMNDRVMTLENELQGVKSFYSTMFGVEITSESWSVLNDSAPYTYSATVTLTKLTSDSTSIELINNNPVLFATHGFAIASVSGSTVIIYSIDRPSADVTLTFEIVNPVSEGE